MISVLRPLRDVFIPLTGRGPVFKFNLSRRDLSLRVAERGYEVGHLLFYTLVERGPTGTVCDIFVSPATPSLQTPHPALLTLQDRAPIIFRSYRLRIIKEGRWRCPVCRTVGGLFGNSHFLASRLVRAGRTHPTKPVLFPTSPTPDPRRPRPERSPRSSAPCRADGAVGPAPIIVTRAVLFPGRLPAVFPRARAHSRDTLPKIMCCTFTRTGHLSQPGPERASLASP